MKYSDESKNLRLQLNLCFKRSLEDTLLIYHPRALQWICIQEDFLIVNCDKNLGPSIIERDVYIERVCRDPLYERDTYLYLPPTLSVSKMTDLKMKFVDWIKRHTKQLPRMEKRFLTTNLQANVDYFPWFYGMIKTHKTFWTMRLIISCTGSLIHTIGVCADSKFQQVASDMPSYFKY